MTCDHCTRARAGIWCGYMANCSECIARALARSLHAFNALHPRGSREREPLREAIQRALPHIDYAAARRMVWQWWQMDRRAVEASDRPSIARAHFPQTNADAELRTP